MKPFLFACAAAGSTLLATAGHAQSADVTLRVVGQPVQNILYTQGETPFFAETLPALSDGRIAAELISAEQLGLSGGEVTRMLSNGAIEFGSGGLNQAVGDAPRFEGCDLPGLTGTLEEARAVCDAYRPVLEKTLEEDFGIKLLALAANPPQAIWCSDPVSGLDDIRGRKIRIFGQALTDFVNGIGATAVAIPYADVVPALQNGVIDCAITGTLTGNTSKWFEVAGYLYPMSLGWAVQYWGVNLDRWNALSEDQQELIEAAYADLEPVLWDLAARATAEGIACNSGEGPCELGIEADMTVVEISEADAETRTAVIRDSILPAFAGRCGADCVADWNDTVGKATGFELAAE
ncbi:TRAP transporter substrate-binding protein [Celeribacter indicus]|uniref:Transport protein n=1 Tax=Celeribacter indicus TaxID=1208324 RepID=A0A0B5DZD8_9RHOB|nr:TRAP transporter substrate-binding protein [Celeribacter indicus]AJE48818.1 transport protein [Celeribacter indicus]SDW38249.1 TRAP-type C4-dicarboxylate transport system, substrate-binding protein [Celeribacter indicus]